MLLLAAPLMRGGNRFVALIPLEILALFVIATLWAGFVLEPRGSHRAAPRPSRALIVLLLGPLWVALVQLTPIPFDWWLRQPGRAIYGETLAAAGIATPAWLSLSVSPAATAASLLAGLPLVATFLLGWRASLGQLRFLLWLVVGMAFAQVALGLGQISGGEHSALFFGVLSFGPPVGTFANRNHYANYIAMALAVYVWLYYEGRRSVRRHPGSSRSSFSGRHATALWVFGALVLVLGILMSRSRGATFFGLTMALCGLSVAALRLNGGSRGLRYAVPVALALLLGAGALIGFDAVVSRMSSAQLASSAGFRGELVRSTFAGAVEFLPWGSGWGTYDLAFQRFLPAQIAAYPNHAHQDYVQFLFEGGILFLVLGACFLWLAGHRAWALVRMARHERLDRDAMAAVLCGLGLLGLLMHSLVDFNLRIPANAMVGALLAGAYLRPLSNEPAQGE
ncbi:MAG TPA: O-antigen ligase family protein [Ramlibacter sp.]|nr:O-antigen ligase family protein [Ramlibacter sp.]